MTDCNANRLGYKKTPVGWIPADGGRCAVGASAGCGANGMPPFSPGGDGAPPSRKRPARMPIADSGSRSAIVFLTVCAKDRKPIFAAADIHKLLVSSWQAAKRWSVGRYVLMPDHIHLFCAPATFPAEPIRSWTKYWKTLVSNAWPHPEQQPIWQQDGWDTQLRRGESYAAKWAYVRNNPVRAGLVSTPDAWPYQGEVNVLMWHDR
jgi:putative transposase